MAVTKRPKPSQNLERWSILKFPVARAKRIIERLNDTIARAIDAANIMPVKSPRSSNVSI